MRTQSDSQAPRETRPDHRVETAQRKRQQMRTRILDATTRVFARDNQQAPAIEDVVREAGISRGTFYNYFDSLDEALVAAGIEMSDRMIADIIPLYDFLKEPWQRASVGFRVYLLRAWQDPKWASFITRMDTWPHRAQIAVKMSADLARGKELGQFEFDDATVATDFVMGASIGVIQAVRNGVQDPQAYIDSAVRMALQAMGCAPELRERAVAFSARHLAGCASGERIAWNRLDRERADPAQNPLRRNLR